MGNMSDDDSFCSVHNKSPVEESEASSTSYQLLDSEKETAEMETAETRAEIEKLQLAPSNPFPLLSSRQWHSIVEFFTQLKVGMIHFGPFLTHFSANDRTLFSLYQPLFSSSLFASHCVLRTYVNRLCVGKITSSK